MSTDLDLVDVALAAVADAASEIRERVAAMSDLDLLRFAMRAGESVEPTPKPKAKRPRKPRAKKSRVVVIPSSDEEEAATSSPRPSYKGRVPDAPPTGLAQNAILAALRTSPRTSAELGERLQIDQKTLSAILSRLKNRGEVLKPEARGGTWRAA
jgi:predicted Rossmann fold nucleotide-binding protein DprA/Smf involved in DNA uptake